MILNSFLVASLCDDLDVRIEIKCLCSFSFHAFSCAAGAQQQTSYSDIIPAGGTGPNSNQCGHWSGPNRSKVQ